MAYIAIEQNRDTIGQAVVLPQQELKELFEIAQAGATGAVASLRDFLGTSSDIQLNCLSFLPVSVLLDRIRLYYQDNLGFHLRFSGDISGEIYTLMRERDAFLIIERMLGAKRKSGKPLDRLEVSVLAEMIHIMANSFWRAMSEKTALNWWFSPPARVNDPARSLAYSAKVFNLDQLLIHFEFLIPGSGIRFQYVFLPSQNTLARLLEGLSRIPAPEEALLAPVAAAGTDA
jgi:chemotaxis protein CheY-P-specific phosphatase CheC